MDPPQFKASLSFSAVLALFGGNAAASAMAMVHILEGRKWLGWYNSPGSYFVAGCYGRLAKSKLSTGLFPETSVDPSIIFNPDTTRCRGPEFIAARSGVKMLNTGYAGHLLLTKCKSLRREMEVEGRKTSQSMVTVVGLGAAPEPVVDATFPRRPSQTLMALVPILSSVSASVLCGISRDWYSFSLILLGILCAGISGLVIGSGSFRFRHPSPAVGSPQGDGVLQSSDSDFVVLLGAEGAVNAITRGSFSFEFAGLAEYRAVHIAAALFTIQSILQLLLIPQGTLFGQSMFLSSLIISWLYNCYIASFDLDMAQANVLTKKVLGDPVMQKYGLGTRTAAIVFVVLALQPPNPGELFDQLLPNTETWKIWKTAVGEKVKRGQELVFTDTDFSGASKEEMSLLDVLFDDATKAYGGYLHYSNSKSAREENVFRDNEDKAAERR